MPIYNVEIHGVDKRLLVRADSAAQAKDQCLKIRALTSEEMANALADGEKIYTPGDSVIPPAAPDPKPDPKVKPEGKEGVGATE